MSLAYRALYKVLFAVGLGWAFNRLRCRLNLYSKFPDGRCHYCGVTNHGLHWRIYQPSEQSIDQAMRTLQ